MRIYSQMVPFLNEYAATAVTRHEAILSWTALRNGGSVANKRIKKAINECVKFFKGGKEVRKGIWIILLVFMFFLMSACGEKNSSVNQTNNEIKDAEVQSLEKNLENGNTMNPLYSEEIDVSIKGVEMPVNQQFIFTNGKRG